MKIILIACIDENNGLGFRNQLLYKIKEDIEFFKSNTINSTILMGKKTYESIGNTPLPKRTNIVLSTDIEFHFTCTKSNYNNLAVYDNINDAIEYARVLNKNLYIIGGQKIYEVFINIADEIKLCKIYANDKESDTFFPEIDTFIWELKEETTKQYHLDYKCFYNFQTYTK